jgi:hypothetical protein
VVAVVLGRSRWNHRGRSSRVDVSVDVTDTSNAFLPIPCVHDAPTDVLIQQGCEKGLLTIEGVAAYLNRHRLRALHVQPRRDNLFPIVALSVLGVVRASVAVAAVVCVDRRDEEQVGCRWRVSRWRTRGWLWEIG